MVVLISRNEFDHQSLLVAITEKYECCVLLAFEDNLFRKSGQIFFVIFYLINVTIV